MTLIRGITLRRGPRGSDMIEHREATRSGCRAARVWAIIPPIEAPTTWARSTSRWSSRPMASWAISRSV